MGLFLAAQEVCALQSFGLEPLLDLARAHDMKEPGLERVREPGKEILCTNLRESDGESRHGIVLLFRLHELR